MTVYERFIQLLQYLTSDNRHPETQVHPAKANPQKPAQCTKQTADKTLSTPQAAAPPEAHPQTGQTPTTDHPKEIAHAKNQRPMTAPSPPLRPDGIPPPL